MRRNVVTVLIFILMCVCTGAFALTTSEKDGMYQQTVLELETYLEEMASGEDNVARLNGASETFNELASYEFSRELYYYTCILMNIDCEDYTDWHTEAWLNQLCKNEKFNKYAEENAGSPIAGAETLKNYYLGRKAEHDGDEAAAIGYYAPCTGYFDAMDRQLKLEEQTYADIYQEAEKRMKQGQYEEAYSLYNQCRLYMDAGVYADYILDSLGYDPEICKGNHQNIETVTKAATCMSEGEAEVTCTVCGKQETITTKKDSSNHTGETEVRNAKEATCGEKGYSGDTYCLACEEKISTGKDIKATGKHKWKDATYDAPKTCKVCGKTEGKPLTRAKVGEYITFGHYPQTSTGKDNTPIEWLVLDVDQISNKALVISRYALDCQPYNSESTGATWETCSLRKWLNSIFLNNAFTAKEQEGIVTETVKTRDNTEWKAYATSYTSVSGGSDTHDKVFLLSIEETMKYGGCSSFADFVNKGTEKMKVIPTKYAVAQGAYQYNGNDSIYRLNDKGCCLWWLRSPGGNSNNASRVRDNGVLSSRKMNGTYGAVRPAFWLNLDSADIY